MWELDYKESWALKNWYFWTVVLEKTPGSPLDSEETKSVHPKGNQSWIFIGRTDADAETPILWPPDAKSQLTGKDTDAGKDWRQEEKGMTEDEMVGWHHRLNGHEFEQAPGVGDGQGSLACCHPRVRKESHTAERLNWTERISCRPWGLIWWGAMCVALGHVLKEPLSSSWQLIRRETGRLRDACPLVSREQGARVKLPKTVGMPRPSGKCQGTQRKGGQGSVWIPVLPLVWYFEVKNHWHFYSGTYLFLILYVLEKEEWQKKLLNIGDVHSNFSNVSWLVCWNPRIFLNYLAHQSSRNSSTKLIWRFCQNKLLLICQQPRVFPYSKYIYIYIYIYIYFGAEK